MAASYIPILLMFIVAAGFAAVALGIAWLLGPSKPDPSKDGTYECGVQLVLIQRPQGPVPRPPQIPRQTVTVSNGVESEITFLIDLTPKGVGP